MKKLLTLILLISAGIGAQARLVRGLATAGLASSGRTGAAVVVGTRGKGPRQVRRDAAWDYLDADTGETTDVSTPWTPVN